MLRYIINSKIFIVIASCLSIGIIFAIIFNAQCRPMPSGMEFVQGTFSEAEEHIAQKIERYNRPEELTYLSFPEWYIVWASQEYADWITKHKPSQFPYFKTIRQFWGAYCRVYSITRSLYPSNMGENISITVLGVSYTVENLIKGLYENTIGRLTELFSDYPATPEDVFIASATEQYVTFILERPFYEFSYANELVHFWNDVSFFGTDVIRKWERKIFFTIEYGIKTIYGWFIMVATQSVFGVAGEDTYAVVDNISDIDALHKFHIQVIATDPSGLLAIKMPRYQAFLEAAEGINSLGGSFKSVSGNTRIVISLIATTTWADSKKTTLPDTVIILFSQPMLTLEDKTRFVVSVPVTTLQQVLTQKDSGQIFIEHVYDY